MEASWVTVGQSPGDSTLGLKASWVFLGQLTRTSDFCSTLGKKNSRVTVGQSPGAVIPSPAFGMKASHCLLAKLTSRVVEVGKIGGRFSPPLDVCKK